MTEARSDAAKPKRPPETTAKARTAKATAAKPAGKAKTAKATTAKPEGKAKTAKTTAAKPEGKAKTAKTTTAKPGATAPPTTAGSSKPETASQTRRVPSSQSGRGHHTQPRTQAPRRAGAKPSSPDPAAGPLGTAVQAAAELAEIGMMASARALRGALSRLPRP